MFFACLCKAAKPATKALQKQQCFCKHKTPKTVAQRAPKSQELGWWPPQKRSKQHNIEEIEHEKSNPKNQKTRVCLFLLPIARSTLASPLHTIFLRLTHSSFLELHRHNLSNAVDFVKCPLPGPDKSGP